MLADAYSNRIFEPACITEDYENGFRIKRLGLAIPEVCPDTVPARPPDRHS